MRNSTSLFSLSMLALSACGGVTPDQNNVVATSGDNGSPATTADGKANAALAVAPCSTPPAKSSDAANSILGISVGMTPDDAARILICDGYQITFPLDEDRRNVRNEEQQGLFRRDFVHPTQRDFVRLFSEGSPGAQQIFYVSRAKLFEQNPPTMEAVAQQFVTTYHPVGGAVRTHLGGLAASRVEYSDHPVGKSVSEVMAQCAGMASMNNADDKFYYGANVPHPDQNCGPSIQFEVIQSGNNPNLAYVARYRLSNPALGYKLREQRTVGEQSDNDAKINADTRKAQTDGELPKL